MTGPDRIKSLRAATANSAVMVTGDGPHFAYWQALQAAYESGALVPQAALSAEYARGREQGLRDAADRLKVHKDQARANLEAVGLDAVGPERTTFNWMRWAESEVRALIPPPPSPVAASADGGEK